MFRAPDAGHAAAAPAYHPRGACILTRKKWLLGGVKVVCAVAAALAVVYLIVYAKTGMHLKALRHMNNEELSDYLRSFGSFAVVIGSCAILLQTWVPFAPFVLLAGANVLVFGLKWGFVINYSMSCLGATAAFLFARYVAHDWIAGKLAKYPAAAQLNERLEKNGFFYVLIGRILFFVPSTAINLGAAISRMRFHHYLFGTLLGKLPIVLLESLIGHDVLHFRKYGGRLAVLLVLFLLLVLVGTLVKKRFAIKKTVLEEE